MSSEAINVSAGEQTPVSPYGYMPDIVAPNGETIGLSEAGKMFLRHQVLPFAYNEAQQQAANSGQNPPAAAV